MSTSFCTRVFLLLGIASPLALAGGVRIVDSAGSASFPDIQSAVNAATNGDVLMIGAGSYGPFTIDGKELFLLAAPGATVAIQGAIVVKNLVGQSVVFVGMTATASNSNPSLRLTNNAGHFRAQSCSFTGSEDFAGVSITGTDAVFASCTLRGGDGRDTIDQNAYPGAPGVSAQSSRVALYDCQAIGGEGGGGDGGNGANGGAGLGGSAYYLCASGTSFRGGDGGDSNDYWNTGTHAGNGGTGLVAPAGTQVELLNDTFAGGAAGYEYHFGGFGLPGQPSIIQGASTFHAGSKRKFTAEAAASDQTSLSVTVNGQPGDQVFLLRNSSDAFLPSPAYRGVWLVALPLFGNPKPIGVVPPNGTLALQVRLPDVPLPLAVERFAYQGLVVDTGGQVFLGSPFQLALLNSASAPDCNANGVQDFVDLIAGAPDCNHNLSHDSCEIAAGLVPDCNVNQIPDACDVASGASFDLNHNGVPDECEGVSVTWYVDAAAAPGGNGSQAAPFRAIGQGISVALPGDTVFVADGIYNGANNRDLDFTGRDLVVRSANGPANCIIDCQNSGRAFYFHNGETSAARVQGFTITGGFGSTPSGPGGGGIAVNACSPTISSCVITHCSCATGSFGGGLYLWGSNSLVEQCSILENSCPTTGLGGGGVAMLAANPGGRSRLSRCRIEGNTTPGGGGGLLVNQTSGAPPSIISHCSILGNSTLGPGGGVYTLGNVGDALLIEDCLIAGNSATQGGGVAGRGTVTLANSTIVDNQATQQGGGLCVTGGAFSVANSIVWENAAPLGAQASLVGYSSSMLVRYSDFQGGEAAISVGASTTLTWGPGSFALNPRFADADGPDNDPLTIDDNDYRLSLSSRCIDAGENASVARDWFDLDGDGNTTEPVPFDLDLLQRFIDVPGIPNSGPGVPPVDLGAFEHP